MGSNSGQLMKFIQLDKLYSEQLHKSSYTQNRQLKQSTKRKCMAININEKIFPDTLFYN